MRWSDSGIEDDASGCFSNDLESVGTEVGGKTARCYLRHLIHRNCGRETGATTQPTVRLDRLTSEATLPDGTRVVFFVRSAPENESLAKRAWTEVNNGSFATQPNHGQLQYRVEIHSENGDRFPVVDSVKIALQP